MAEENIHATVTMSSTSDPTNEPSRDEFSDRSDSRFLGFDLEDETLNLDCLTARELFMVTRRYGLDGEPPQTLTEIAGLFDVSRETVRQTVLRATEKLKDAARLGRL